MSKFNRVKKKNNYAIIDTGYVRNPNLSAKAKGILTYLLQLPDDWVIYQEELPNHFTDSISSIRSGIKELEQNGYIERIRNRDAKGRLMAYEYNVYEEPIHMRFSNLENLNQKNNVRKSNTTNNLCTKDLPTNDLDTKNNNNVQSPKDDLNERFETVYKLYPKKQGKKRALAAYKKAIKAGVTDETIIDGIQRYCFMLETTRTNAKYIKQAGTWFFNEGWNDEYATDGRFRANAGTNQTSATESGGIVERIAKQRAASGKPLDNGWESEIDDLEWFD